MMRKTISIFMLLFTSLMLACGRAASLPTPVPASVEESSPTPSQPVPPTESSVTEKSPDVEQGVSVPGLRVLYLREGDLWSWTEAGGNSQLTDTGDMSTLRISEDGQLLAYMRGDEVWTINMDGTDARLLASLSEDGSALWFAPGGSALAVSTPDHIDVIDLDTLETTTVLKYPTISDGYNPEVVWTTDSSGFKTVIPPQKKTGKAELLFVFTDGTVASLAKFAMKLSSASAPFISPDGGYVIYVSPLGDGKESLYLMDSSGATRPYGEPAVGVRAYAWLPDSARFVYAWEEPQRTFIGNVSGPPAFNKTVFPQIVRWVDNKQYIAIQNDELFLGDFDGVRMPVDSPVSDFDFVP